MRAARMRVVHLIAVIGIVMVLVTVEIVTTASLSLRDLPKLTMWFVGCGIFVALGTLWYRARVRATERLRDAVERRAPLRNVEAVHLRVRFVPFWSEVDMDVDGPDGVALHLAFGFWTRESADRLLWFLRDLIVAPKVRAARSELPRAVLVSSDEPSPTKDDA